MAMLFGRIIGDGPPVVLLHGLGAAHSYWQQPFDALGAGHRLASVDLRGFGASMDLPGPYDLNGHLTALEDFCGARLGSVPVALVGHSFGALLALYATTRWPSVRIVVAFNLPVFHDASEARAHLAGLSVLTRWMTDGSAMPRVACWLMCHLRPLLRALAPRLVRNVPPAVARDAVAHRWPAFRDTFRAIVEETRAPEWIARSTARIQIVQGQDDPICPPAMLRRNLGGTRAGIQVWAGDHHLPLRAPERCANAVCAALGGEGCS